MALQHSRRGVSGLTWPDGRARIAVGAAGIVCSVAASQPRSPLFLRGALLLRHVGKPPIFRALESALGSSSNGGASAAAHRTNLNAASRPAGSRVEAHGDARDGRPFPKSPKSLHSRPRLPASWHDEA